MKFCEDKRKQTSEILPKPYRLNFHIWGIPLAQVDAQMTLDPLTILETAFYAANSN